MERMKLKKSPLEVLEIGLPDGGELVLKLKNPTVNESDQIEKDLLVLNLKRNKKDEHGELIPQITNTQFAVQSLKLICEEFDIEIIGDLEVDHLTDILEKVREVQKKATERKKKREVINCFKELKIRRYGIGKEELAELPAWKFDAYFDAAEAMDYEAAWLTTLKSEYLKNKVLEKLAYDGSKKFEADKDATKQYVRDIAEAAAKKHKEDKDAAEKVKAKK